MSELVGWLELEGRLHSAISSLEAGWNPRDEVLKVLRQCYAYLSWTEVQDAMREAREIQKIAHEMMKEMD